jgi:hypothetical protein
VIGTNALTISGSPGHVQGYVEMAIDGMTLAKVCHLEILEDDDLPYLIKRRQVVYDCLNDREHPMDAKEFARLWEMMMWATEQIAFLKGRVAKEAREGRG